VKFFSLGRADPTQSRLGKIMLAWVNSAPKNHTPDVILKLPMVVKCILGLQAYNPNFKAIK